MSVRSPTAGTWSSSQWRPDNEFETHRVNFARFTHSVEFTAPDFTRTGSGHEAQKDLTITMLDDTAAEGDETLGATMTLVCVSNSQFSRCIQD